MGFNLKEWIIGGQTFCCCLPTRMGVIIMSFLTMIVSLLLAIILFFEVATAHYMTPHQHTIFILVGIVEVLLCVTSVLGFAGTIAKKLAFVRAYAYFLYFHFLLNFGVATYLLWMINHAAHTDVVKACENIATAGTKDQCSGLINIAKNVYLAVAAVLLLIEMYGALIVTRYVRQLRFEKARDKAVRQSALAPRPRSQLPADAEHIALLNASAKPAQVPGAELADAYEGIPYQDAPVREADAEHGYGGGAWRMSALRAEEKARVAEHGAPDDASVYSADQPPAVPPVRAEPHPPAMRAGSGTFAPPPGAPPHVSNLAPPVGGPPAFKDDDDEDDFR